MNDTIEKLRILILEDVSSDAELMENTLREAGLDFIALRVETREAYLRALEDFEPHLLLADYQLPSFDGRSALQIARQTHPELPVIVVSGVLGESAVELLKEGACDYVLKDHLARLTPAVRRALAEQEDARALKLAEAALRESEAHFRRLAAELEEAQRLAHVGSWELNPQTGTVTWSKEIYRIFGRDPNLPAPRYQEHGQILTAESLERLNAVMEKLNRTGEDYEIDLEIIRSDGTRGWITARGEAKRNAASQIEGLRGTALDISERKQAEELVSRLVAVIEQAGDSIVITNLDAEIVFVNPFFELLTGYSAVEAIGQNPRILKSACQSPSFYRELWDTLTAGKVWNGHFVNRKKDGSLYHEDATIFPVQDGQGRLVNYAAVKRDVTARMQAEAQIRKLSLLYATLSHINEIIVRATNRNELFQGICQGAVEHGKFVMAWVGLVDEGLRKVLPLCHSGQEQGYVENIRISIDDVQEGRGPTGTAIRENRIVYVNDYASDERAQPWREAALRRGFRGAAALPIRLAGQVIGALTLYVAELDFFDDDQIKLLQEMSQDISYALDHFEQEAQRQWAEQERETALNKLRKTLEGSIQVVASMIEVRDPYTAGHQRRVSKLATAIARLLALCEDQVEGIGFGSLIHDIGKIAVPAEILSSPKILTGLQMELIHLHPLTGHDILKGIDFPWPVAQMILQHHERLDGSGYPDGLKAGDIIAEARILAVADVVEAMSSHRPYRPSRGIAAALAEISAGRGLRYDPQAVDACLSLFREQGFDF
ncbi:MAG: PAS domain S-box protein [Methylococcaceae bacterium]|nr:PAS domain S-box protein [Methylococcaceae bacterium]